MRVLGIDPGSIFLGLGCVEAKGSGLFWVGHQLVRVTAGGGLALEVRLRVIHEAVTRALRLWQPEAVAVEETFFAKNAQSALVLGQARGAALVPGAVAGLPLFEYPATVVKQTVTGSGRSEKVQVQKMVSLLLGRSLPREVVFEREDVSDALAVAICHLNHRSRLEKISEARGRKKLSPSPGL